MRKHLKNSKAIFESFVNRDYTNLQILNELNITHGYPIKESNSLQIEVLEPSDEFTKFLIFSELLYGQGRVP